MTFPPDTPLSMAIRPEKQAVRRHYGSHPYFTKRAWNVVQEYIRHYSPPGGVVLDPYGGSGVTAVESLVTHRKAMYVDISEWACFLARQTAVAPADLGAVKEAFVKVELGCRNYLESLWETPSEELGSAPADWYPKGIRLPGSADVDFVEDLFTPRMLHGLARLRACIADAADGATRDLLLMAFSATLARINRTFLSTTNRRESRGGSAIFSLYRYKVAKRPVELPLWKQFATRFDRLLQAKRETNTLIGDYYKEGETAIFRHGSATELGDWIKPGSVDYIYTDPPYGAHIAYLDLSTMWAAWLGFNVSQADRRNEVIEGGELRKSRDEYHALLSLSLRQMHETLKSGRWLSLVFAHRDTAYWEALVGACRDVGFEYVNTVAQPVGVVWSVHKKKNPLRVLSGELVLNFRKRARSFRARPPSSPTGDATQIVRECCEAEIIRGLGAKTEDLHHAVVPRLLESGLLTEFSRRHGDLTPLLAEFFDFDKVEKRWHLRDGGGPAGPTPKEELARYHIVRFLRRSAREGSPVTEAEIVGRLDSLFANGCPVSAPTIRSILEGVAYSPDGRRWRPSRKGGQRSLFFDQDEA